MGEGACQLDTLVQPSWEHEVTYETIPISVAYPQPQLQVEVLNIFFNVWESIGDDNVKHLFS